MASLTLSINSRLHRVVPIALSQCRFPGESLDLDDIGLKRSEYEEITALSFDGVKRKCSELFGSLVSADRDCTAAREQLRAYDKILKDKAIALGRVLVVARFNLTEGDYQQLVIDVKASKQESIRASLESSGVDASQGGVHAEFTRLWRRTMVYINKIGRAHV